MAGDVDESTQQQIDELLEEHDARQREQRAVRRRLAVLREQAAGRGRDAPAEVVTEIADLETKATRLTTELHEIKRRLTRLSAEASAAALFTFSPDEMREPSRAASVLVAQNQNLYREIQRSDERTAWRFAGLSERLDGVDERVDAMDTASREWRQSERAAREDGQASYRLTVQAIVAALLLLLVANVVMLMLILTRT